MFSCYILQISLLSSPLGNSFDVPVAKAEIDRFSAEVEKSPAVIDESSGTKNLEVLGSIKVPKVFPFLFFRRMSMVLYSQKRKAKALGQLIPSKGVSFGCYLFVSTDILGQTVP